MSAVLPVLRAGSGRLTVRRVEGASAVVASAATDPLKLLVTAPRGPCVWAYTTTYGGGLLAGDAVDLQVQVEAGASLFLGSQASTKIYRSPDGIPTRQRFQLQVADDAVAVVLPDPVTPFAEAVHEQEQELRLSAGAALIWSDGVTSGRAARNERWSCTRHRTRLRLFVADRLVLHEGLDLSAGLSRPLVERMGSIGAMSTMLIGGPALRGRAEALLAECAARPLPAAGAALVTAAPLAGWGSVVRIAAPQRETLDQTVRALLGDLRSLLADDPWQRRP
jgi:urease accessory protein